MNLLLNVFFFSEEFRLNWITHSFHVAPHLILLEWKSSFLTYLYKIQISLLAYRWKTISFQPTAKSNKSLIRTSFCKQEFILEIALLKFQYKCNCLCLFHKNDKKKLAKRMKPKKHFEKFGLLYASLFMCLFMLLPFFVNTLCFLKNERILRKKSTSFSINFFIYSCFFLKKSNLKLVISFIYLLKSRPHAF